MSFKNLFIVLSSFSIASHLFTAIIAALPLSWAIPAIFVSWSVMPSCASITSTATSQRSTAATARIILYFSISSLILLFLRIPAVSIKTYFCPSSSKGVSIASLVVPGILLTISLSSPSILFIRDDFPTFGFPIRATFITSSSSAFSAPSGK